MSWSYHNHPLYFHCIDHSSCCSKYMTKPGVWKLIGTNIQCSCYSEVTELQLSSVFWSYHNHRLYYAPYRSYDPAAVNTWPNQVYGSWLAQTSSVLVTVNSGVTVRFSVLIVSQPPVVLCTVSMIVLAPVNTWPIQVYGSWLAHTSSVLVTVSNGVTVKFSVLIVSQPPVVLALYRSSVPAAVNTWPNQVYGSWLAQTSSVLVTVNSGVTVKFNVLIVSQPPVVLCTVSIIDPAAVNTCPNQVYGSWLAQTSSVLVTVNSGVTVKFNVLIVSQPPVVLCTVSMIVLAPVNTWPTRCMEVDWHTHPVSLLQWRAELPSSSMFWSYHNHRLSFHCIDHSSCCSKHMSKPGVWKLIGTNVQCPCYCEEWGNR